MAKQDKNCVHFGRRLAEGEKECIGGKCVICKDGFLVELQPLGKE